MKYIKNALMKLNSAMNEEEKKREKPTYRQKKKKKGKKNVKLASVIIKDREIYSLWEKTDFDTFSGNIITQLTSFFFFF